MGAVDAAAAAQRSGVTPALSPLGCAYAAAVYAVRAHGLGFKTQQSNSKNQRQRLAAAAVAAEEAAAAAQRSGGSGGSGMHKALSPT